MSINELTIRKLQVRGLNVPLDKPLATSGGTISSVPLVLIDIYTQEDIVGSAYVFCYTSLALKATVELTQALESLIVTEKAVPCQIANKLQKTFTLLGMQGLTAIAAAGIDMALWDIVAKAAGLPLCQLLGGDTKPIKAYRSYFMGGVAGGIADAEMALTQGFSALKTRLGYSTLQEDMNVVNAILNVVGDQAQLMVDYNQSLFYTDALARLVALDQQGLLWIEEPLRADDYVGHAQLTEQLKTPIQLGENFWGIHDMQKSLDAKASRFIMLDVMKIGGVSGWIKAAALAEAAGLLVSSHIFDEISAHLLAVTPTALYLESMNLAAPILATPLAIKEGYTVLNDEPGNGIRWNEEMISKLA